MDRLTPEWPQYTGEELLDEEESEVGKLAGDVSSQGSELPPKSELTETVEEAFRYVHFPEGGNA